MYGLRRRGPPPPHTPPGVTAAARPCSAFCDRRAPSGVPRVHAQARRQLAPLPPGPPLPAAVFPRLLPPLPQRPRARPGQGRPDRRLQPPQLPRPVRDRRLPAVDEAAQLRRQGRAVRAALAGLGALPPRRLPDPPRRIRRGLGRDRPQGGRTRRHRLHLPRGHPDQKRRPRLAQARRRPPRPADRRPRRPGRCDRQRTRPPRLADPAAQGQDQARQGDDLPHRRGARRRPWPKL